MFVEHFTLAGFISGDNVLQCHTLVGADNVPDTLNERKRYCRNSALGFRAFKLLLSYFNMTFVCWYIYGKCDTISKSYANGE